MRGARETSGVSLAEPYTLFFDSQDSFHRFFQLIIIIIINHIALSCNSYGKLPQLYYSTVLARNKVASGYPSAVIFHACEQASVFSLDSRSKTSDREPYLAHDPLDQRGLWAFRPPEP